MTQPVHLHPGTIEELLVDIDQMLANPGEFEIVATSAVFADVGRRIIALERALADAIAVQARDRGAR